MATCPQCNTSSRTDPTAMILTPTLLPVEPVDRFSLAGVMPKMTARAGHRLTCRCGWTTVGQMVDGHLIPTTTEG
jgi:hypothetical protein